MKFFLRGVSLFFITLSLLSCNEDETIKPEREQVQNVTLDSIPTTAQPIQVVSDSILSDSIDFDSVYSDTLFSDSVSEALEEHFPEYLQPEVNIYGHYTYLPKEYSDTSSSFPLIIFLHGVGEKGNSKKDTSDLSNVLRTGVPELIEQGRWNPGFPAIVVSPQCHENDWDPDKLHKFIEYLHDKYRVDKAKIYLTGISLGAIGTFEYLGNYGDSSYVAAAVAICGAGNIDKASSFQNIPVWAFHGEADNVISVNKSIAMIRAIKKSSPANTSLLTTFPSVGHISWTMTYDKTGMGKESKKHDPFKEDVFTWMYKHTKSNF